MIEFIIPVDDLKAIVEGRYTKHELKVLVRCKDCKWWGEKSKPDGRRCCDLLGIRLEPEFWCAYGERIEDGKG